MDVTDAMQAEARALGDPSRFAIFRHLVSSVDGLGVADLTERMGFNHNAIRQHLSVLVDARLVVAEDEPRRSPGRPRKRFRVRRDALASFRHVGGSYERLAEWLLEIVTSGDSPYEVGRRVGAERASEGDEGQLVSLLAVDGFEPVVDDASIVLGHCPFADVASQDAGVVCELHRGLIDGALGGGSTAKLEIADPHRAGCRVTLGV